MGYAKHVGRVGTLAVALGIGAAVATTPGVAWADGEPEPGIEAPKAPEGPSESGVPSTERQDPGEVIRRNIERAADDLRDGIRKAITGVGRSSGGAITSTHRNGSNSSNGNVPPVVIEDEEEHLDNLEPPKDEEKSSSFVANNTTNPLGNFTPPRWRAPQAQVNTGPAPKPIAKAIDDVKDVVQQSINAVTGNQAPTGSTPVGRNAFSTLDSLETEDQQQARPGFVAPISIITNVVNAALAPFLNPTPGQPAPQNPILWAVLGWVRRQVQETPFGKVVLNRTPRIDTETTAVEDNGDGTFTITTPASDPDGDDLTFAVASRDGEGTITPLGEGKFLYDVTAADWDGDDEVTVTVSDAADYPHLHGLASFLSPAAGHTATITLAIKPEGEQALPEPEVQKELEETVTGSGKFDAEFTYDETVTDVHAAFDPKYWRVVDESFEDGVYKVTLEPTEAGKIRAALGLQTSDRLVLQVVKAPTIQTMAFRSAGLAALAEEDPPEQAYVLPTPPGALLQVDDPAIPVGTRPAGVVVTNKYAYVLNSLDGTVSVIGADPNDPLTYNKVLDMDENDGEDDIDPLTVGQSPTFGAVSGDRLYVLNGADRTISIINTQDNSFVDADENDGENDIDPIEVPSGFNAVASPDGKRLYLFGGQEVYVVDIDPESANYNKVLDVDGDESNGIQGISVAPPPDEDPSDGTTFSSSISGGLSSDGSRLYVPRIYATQIYNEEEGTYEVVYESGDVVVIDTATNTVIGDTIVLDQYPGYVTSSGDRLYVTSLDPDDLRNISNPNVPAPAGYVTVVDIDPDSPTYNTQVDRIDVGRLALNVAMSPDRSLAYAVNGGDGTVSVIDTVTNEVLTAFTFDPDPAGTLNDASFVAISPDGERLYVSRHLDGEVVAISINRNL